MINLLLKKYTITFHHRALYHRIIEVFRDGMLSQIGPFHQAFQSFFSHASDFQIESCYIPTKKN